MANNSRVTNTTDTSDTNYIVLQEGRRGRVLRADEYRSLRSFQTWGRMIIVGVFLICGLWQALADSPTMMCGYQGTVMMTNPTSLYPLSPGEAYIWATYDDMKAAFEPLKKAIKALTDHWAMGGSPIGPGRKIPNGGSKPDPNPI